jgi:hypothetical protein
VVNLCLEKKITNQSGFLWEITGGGNLWYPFIRCMRRGLENGLEGEEISSVRSSDIVMGVCATSNCRSSLKSLKKGEAY